jgi:phosphonate transport system substrate-binding protein
MSKRVFGTVLLGCVALSMGAMLLLRRRNIPEVDFKQVGQAATTLSSTGQQPLRVAIAAMISPAITKRYYEELFRLVGDRLGRSTQLIQRKTYAEVNALVEDRSVDMAFVCSGPYVLGHAKFGMELLALPVVGGASIYYSYVLVKPDSDIKSFEDLRGRRFAFTDPDSNTGCLVPRFMLAKMQTTPESFFRETFFTHSHDNSIKAVAEGMADGAAVDSLIWDFLKATAPAAVAGTAILHKSPPYGIPPLVVHPDLDPTLKARMKEVLLQIHRDPLARPLLDSIRVERFIEGKDEVYTSVREMQAWLDTRK